MAPAPANRELSHPQKRPFLPLTSASPGRGTRSGSSGGTSPNEQSAITDLEGTRAEGLGEGKKAERPRGESFSLRSRRREGWESTRKPICFFLNAHFWNKRRFRKQMPAQSSRASPSKGVESAQAKTGHRWGARVQVTWAGGQAAPWEASGGQ